MISTIIQRWHYREFKTLVYMGLSLLCSGAGYAQAIKLDKLIVVGYLNTVNQESGTVRYNSMLHDYEVWNGVYWASLTGLQFKTGVVSDIDSNSYRTVKIADQVWMVDNLRTSRYRDGTSITLITDNTEWELAHYGGYSWYKHLDSLDSSIGKLYNGHAINDYRGICPDGWRVPTDTEWTELISYLDTGIVNPDIIGTQSEIVGEVLKDMLLHFWNFPHYAGTNHAGFSSRGSGIRFQNGLFLGRGLYAYYWSSTLHNGNIYVRSIPGQSSEVERGLFSPVYGFSVRCLKDTP